MHTQKKEKVLLLPMTLGLELQTLHHWATGDLWQQCQLARSMGINFLHTTRIGMGIWDAFL